MKKSSRKILLVTILMLLIFLYWWMDDLFVKQMGLLNHRYEIIKIVLQSVLAYKLAKYLIKKFGLNKRYNSIEPQNIFLIVFLLCNSYIITQYTTRVITNCFVNKDIRKALNRKTLKLPPAGWGYQSDSLSYPEFKELTKFSRIIELPRESKLIFVYDWYEFDFRRIVEFDVPITFDIHEFYENDSTVLKKIRELKYNEFLYREIYDENGEFKDAVKLKVDTNLFKRYKYEIFDS